MCMGKQIMCMGKQITKVTCNLIEHLSKVFSFNFLLRLSDNLILLYKLET